VCLRRLLATLNMLSQQLTLGLSILKIDRTQFGAGILSR
jgi:hypothetical protein